MTEIAIYAVVLVISVCLFGGLGAWIAAEKGRNPTEGAILGAMFGPLGALIEALLPQGDYERVDPEPFRPTILAESPERLPWLAVLDRHAADGAEPAEPGEPATPEHAWLRDLENKARKKA